MAIAGKESHPFSSPPVLSCSLWWLDLPRPTSSLVKSVMIVMMIDGVSVMMNDAGSRDCGWSSTALFALSGRCELIIELIR